MKLLDTFRLRRSSLGGGPRQGEAGAASQRVQTPAGVDTTRNEEVRRRCLKGDDLLARGAAQSALEAYQGAIDVADACIDGHLGQAHAYLALNSSEDAADCLEVALALDPASLPALRLLARVRRDTGADEAALDLLQRAATVAPMNSDVLLELGLALNRRGDTEHAMQVYGRAVRATPENPGPHVNLGLIHLQQLGDPLAAEAAFRAALAAAPQHIEAATNLGLALHDQGRLVEAFEIYRRGEQQHPQCSEFRWNRAIGELALGEYRSGWEGYGLRFVRPGGRKLERFPYPDWDGAALRSGRLLVLAEQGLGDEIMFASCLTDLAALCDGLILECAPRLASLFRRSLPAVAVHGVERHDALDWLGQYPDIAVKVAIGSLPRYLRSTIDAFAPHGGYLHPDPMRTRAYSDGLQQKLGAAVRVGISWRAGTRGTRSALRSLDLDALRPLLGTPNVCFVCLQHGLSAEEARQVRELGMLIVEEALADLDECAALISALDLVITVANTNAHLSGALGHPTWVLLNSSPEWRWLRATERTPWYPSALLFRAAAAQNWNPVLTETAERLRALAASPRPHLGRFGCGGAT